MRIPTMRLHAVRPRRRRVCVPIDARFAPLCVFFAETRKRRLLPKGSGEDKRQSQSRVKRANTEQQRRKVRADERGAAAAVRIGFSSHCDAGGHGTGRCSRAAVACALTQ